MTMSGRHTREKRGERRSVTGYLRNDPAAIISNSEQAATRGSDQAESVFDRAHHGNVSVPETIHAKVPSRRQHETDARLSISARRVGEVQVFADSHRAGLPPEFTKGGKERP